MAPSVQISRVQRPRNGRRAGILSPPRKRRQENDHMAEAAWLPDPAGVHELRYWDGAQWTEHTSN